jgi:hypothetical protein
MRVIDQLLASKRWNTCNDFKCVLLAPIVSEGLASQAMKGAQAVLPMHAKLVEAVVPSGIPDGKTERRGR